jgi:hypothetical protein
MRTIQDGATKWLRLDVSQLFLAPETEFRLLQGIGLVEVVASIPCLVTDEGTVGGPFLLLARGRAAPIWHPERSVENVVLGVLLETDNPEGAADLMLASVLAA